MVSASFFLFILALLILSYILTIFIRQLCHVVPKYFSSTNSLLSGADSSLNPAVIDLVLYNGEPLGLYRLAYLRNVVGFFVFVESNLTFSERTKILFILIKRTQFRRTSRRK